MDHDVDMLMDDVEAATERLIGSAAALDDHGVHAPSSLPGWTRGHVIAHLARSADSMTNLLVWARTGVETPQYANAAARDAGIADGAPRDAAEQIADLRDTARRFAETARAMPAAAWAAEVRSFNGDAHPGWFTLVRRWCEVEIHHVDLGTGYSTGDWSAAFAGRLLDYTADRWTLLGKAPVAVLRDTGTGREWRFAAGGEPPEVAGPGPALAAWVVGRSAGSGLASTPGPLPDPPSWP
jgi:maleylpyruvate isomerase